MENKSKSCLSEECTKTIEEINTLLKEAKKKYLTLPRCLQDISTPHKENTKNSLGWYLVNTETSAFAFAKEFGIEIER